MARSPWHILSFPLKKPIVRFMMAAWEVCASAGSRSGSMSEITRAHPSPMSMRDSITGKFLSNCSTTVPYGFQTLIAPPFSAT